MRNVPPVGALPASGARAAPARVGEDDAVPVVP